MATDGRFVDFDKFSAESSGEPVRLRFRGKVYDLNPELPAALALDIQRAMPGDGQPFQVSADQIEMWSRGIFREHYTEIVEESGIGVQSLANLISAVVVQYGADEPAPNREARRHPGKKPTSTSSPTGRSSKRTSSVSTVST